MYIMLKLSVYTESRSFLLEFPCVILLFDSCVNTGTRVKKTLNAINKL